MKAPLLQIQDLNVYFGKESPFHALKDVNITLEKGRITALIGTSGSGKSVTSLALMGLLPVHTSVTGRILLDGTDLLALDERSWRRYRGSKVSMIFQEPMTALNPLLTCGEQVREAYQRHHPGAAGAQARQKAIEWLGKVQLPDPEKIYNKYPHEISGGQKQRIVIAMAMINEPELIIADEPTTALDVLVQGDIIRLLKSLQLSAGSAVLFITHDLALAHSVADAFIEMKDGRIVERSLEGEDVKFRETDTEDSRVLLNIVNLSVIYNKDKINELKAVDNVSLTVAAGKTTGLIGGSGCGKTTLSKALLGLVPVSGGQIIYQGHDDLARLPAARWKKLRKHIQVVFQDPYSALNPKIKIGDALHEVLKVHTSLSKKERELRIVSLLEKVEMSARDMYKYPHEFSGGQRQRICIARALILEPQLVICDESVAALDVIIRNQILELLITLQQDLGLTYLFITHDINVVKKICDYVYVMQEGKIIEEGVPSHVVLAPEQAYTKRLIRAVPKT